MAECVEHTKQHIVLVDIKISSGNLKIGALEPECLEWLGTYSSCNKAIKPIVIYSGRYHATGSASKRDLAYRLGKIVLETRKTNSISTHRGKCIVHLCVPLTHHIHT